MLFVYKTMNNSVNIEKLKREHIEGVAKIENVCFSEPWSTGAFESEINNENAFFYIASVDNIIAGYMGFHTVLDEGYVANIAVLPEYRRQGIASALMQNAVNICKSVPLSFLSLEVRISNGAAIALYERFGFKIVGERKNFYSSPKENAYIMTLYFDR